MNQDIKDGELVKYCPYCQAESNYNAIVCSNCGYSFPEKQQLQFCNPHAYFYINFMTRKPKNKKRYLRVFIKKILNNFQRKS